MRYACDCDLRKLYVIGEDGVVLANGKHHLVLPPVPGDVLLFEIASPKDYTGGMGGEGQAHNKRRWMLFNMHMATLLDACWTNFLVSPSSVWTRGMQIGVRHQLAGCTAKNKDLREAECMLYMHSIRPQDWVSLDQFIDSL